MLIGAGGTAALGLVGGGTDLSPFCDQHGGAILNATISPYADATLQPLQGDRVISEPRGTGQTLECPAAIAELPGGNQLQLHQAVYRRLVKDFRGGEPFPCRLTTYCDAPPGSGLRSSSTPVIAMLQAFAGFSSPRDGGSGVDRGYIGAHSDRQRLRLRAGVFSAG